jgi:hypothetical protein
MAQKFPGITHVVNVWPKGAKEPKIRSEYLPRKNNLITIWGNGLVEKYMPSSRQGEEV